MDTVSGAVTVADEGRVANLGRDRDERTALGQFLTPPPIARLMASMFDQVSGRIRLLDPGAGTGALTAAFVEAMSTATTRPSAIEVVCFEIDQTQLPGLHRTLERCVEVCAHAGIAFSSEVITEDFIACGATLARVEWERRFDAVIMNPPYRKIATVSKERRDLRSIGIETVNLYTAFMAVAIRLLDADGQLVAISPRSYCNGPYYRPFRAELLRLMDLRRIHVFAKRDVVFGDDEVLQENVIIHAQRRGAGGEGGEGGIIISESVGIDDVQRRRVARDAVVKPQDPDQFIHITSDESAEGISRCFDRMRLRLSDLGLKVSTGPVVDFRLRPHLRDDQEDGNVPLYWPMHCRIGATCHPATAGRKPQWIAVTPETTRWLVPNERFVLVKRFSSKEEKRRVVAVVHDPASTSAARIGIENHLNFIHCDGRGLSVDLAAGIAAYLNCGLLDLYFRQFNGHTQVNATDLRAITFPDLASLEKLGRRAGRDVTDPDLGDALIKATAGA